MLKDKKINILKQSQERDDSGEPIDVFITVAENIWAYYRQISGSEFFAAATSNTKVEAIFEINWRNDIDTTMVIEYKGEKYGITRIDDYEGYKNDLKIYAYKVN
jgi:SPP1 family predicted phage head-tail adaptor